MDITLYNTLEQVKQFKRCIFPMYLMLSAFESRPKQRLHVLSIQYTASS